MISTPWSARNSARPCWDSSKRTVRLQRSITWRPRSCDSSTSHRKLGLSSGAPPVMSTVDMLGLAVSSCMTRRATSGAIISVRLGRRLHDSDDRPTRRDSLPAKGADDAFALLGSVELANHPDIARGAVRSERIIIAEQARRGLFPFGEHFTKYIVVEVFFADIGAHRQPRRHLAAEQCKARNRENPCRSRDTRRKGRKYGFAGRRYRRDDRCANTERRGGAFPGRSAVRRKRRSR